MLETSLLCRQCPEPNFGLLFLFRIKFMLSMCTQEFMILPTGASSFKEAMKMGVEVYHNLKVSLMVFFFSLFCWEKFEFNTVFVILCSLLSRRSMVKMPPMLVMKVVLLRTFRLVHNINALNTWPNAFGSSYQS
jgi:hypothetical protein